MALSADQKAKIRGLYDQAVAAGHEDYQSATDFLNAPRREAEPESARPQIPQPPSNLELLNAIDPVTAKSLAELPNFEQTLQAVHDDPAKAAARLLFLMKAGKISDATAGAIQALLERTIPDASWTPKVTERPSLWRETFGNQPFVLSDGAEVAGQCYLELIEEAEGQ